LADLVLLAYPFAGHAHVREAIPLGAEFLLCTTVGVEALDALACRLVANLSGLLAVLVRLARMRGVALVVHAAAFALQAVFVAHAEDALASFLKTDKLLRAVFRGLAEDRCALAGIVAGVAAPTRAADGAATVVAALLSVAVRNTNLSFRVASQRVPTVGIACRDLGFRFARAL
jgi:hypothetical protein